MALDSEQLANARLIYTVGRAMGMSNRDIQIGLITAMQESSLRNLDYGDRDSLGLFQQRPSQGWGTPQQVTDPTYAAKKFFSTLNSVEGRQGMSMAEAAQAVQRSAYPDAYSDHIGLVRTIWPKIVDGRLKGGPKTDDLLGNVKDIFTQEDDQPLPYPGMPSASALMGATTSPIMAAPDVLNANPLAQQQTEDWYPLITPSSFQKLSEGTSWGEGMPYGKGVDQWRKAVVQAAKTALGTPYSWGGNSLQGGVDCSGLVQQAYAKVGIQVPRVSYQQANYGKRVSLNKLLPGDLVAWDNSSRNSGADHIAIYIGDGKIIEAAKPGTRVRIRRLGDTEGAWGVRMNG